MTTALLMDHGRASVLQEADRSMLGRTLNGSNRSWIANNSRQPASNRLSCSNPVEG